jgi:hypothetical protein
LYFRQCLLLSLAEHPHPFSLFRAISFSIA